MSLEVGTRIQDLVATNPVGATDFVSQGDDHIRLLKVCIQGSFPSLGANAVTASADELNILDGATLSTAELNFVDGVTSSIQDQIDDITTSVPLLFQPLDSDLTAIAALTTTSFGRGFLDLADLAALATKINALVPSWSGAHAFAQNVTVAAPTTGIPLVVTGKASASEVIRLTAGASGGAGVGANDGTGNYLFGSGVLVAGVWSVYSVTAAAERLKISANGNVTINAPGSGIAQTVNLLSGQLGLSVEGDMSSNFGFQLVSSAGSTGRTAMLFARTGGTAKSWAIGNDTDGGTDNSFDIRDITRNEIMFSISSAGACFVTDAGTQREAGFRHLPLVNPGSSHTAVQANNGKAIFYTSGSTGALTLPVLEAGTLLTFVNDNTATTLTQSSTSIYWMTGSSRVGPANRTLAIGAVVTIYYFASGTIYIWGTGIS